MRRRRSGNVIVVVAGGALVFLGFLALVIDVGCWYVRRAELEGLADLAAVAALRSGASDREGLSARCHEVFDANGATGVLAVGCESDGAGVRLQLRYAEPGARWFSAALTTDSLQISVAAAAERDATGRVRRRP